MVDFRGPLSILVVDLSRFVSIWVDLSGFKLIWVDFGWSILIDFVGFWVDLGVDFGGFWLGGWGEAKKHELHM